MQTFICGDFVEQSKGLDVSLTVIPYHPPCRVNVCEGGTHFFPFGVRAISITWTEDVMNL